MRYTLEIPCRRLEALFGTAFPNLSLSPTQKSKYISLIYAAMNNTTAADYDRRAVPKQQSFIYVESIDVFKMGWIIGSKIQNYDIIINDNAARGYKIASAIEKHAYSKVKRLSIFGPPRFWNRIFHSGRPQDTYLISEEGIPGVHTWLETHCKPKDYRIFSKFGTDYSIGFRNNELATLFQLSQGL